MRLTCTFSIATSFICRETLPVAGSSNHAAPNVTFDLRIEKTFERLCRSAVLDFGSHEVKEYHGVRSQGLSLFFVRMLGMLLLKDLHPRHSYELAHAYVSTLVRERRLLSVAKAIVSHGSDPTCPMCSRAPNVSYLYVLTGDEAIEVAENYSSSWAYVGQTGVDLQTRLHHMVLPVDEHVEHVELID